MKGQPFSAVLDHALWRRRMDQRAFAATAGLLPSSVSRWRSGKSEPDLQSFIKACRVLPELRTWMTAQIKKPS